MRISCKSLGENVFFWLFPTHARPPKLGLGLVVAFSLNYSFTGSLEGVLGLGDCGSRALYPLVWVKPGPGLISRV